MLTLGWGHFIYRGSRYSRLQSSFVGGLEH